MTGERCHIDICPLARAGCMKMDQCNIVEAYRKGQQDFEKVKEMVKKQK